MFSPKLVLFRKKSAKIKSAYKQDYFHGTADVDFDFAGPAVQASAVVGYVCYAAVQLSDKVRIVGLGRCKPLEI